MFFWILLFLFNDNLHFYEICLSLEIQITKGALDCCIIKTEMYNSLISGVIKCFLLYWIFFFFYHSWLVVKILLRAIIGPWATLWTPLGYYYFKSVEINQWCKLECEGSVYSSGSVPQDCYLDCCISYTYCTHTFNKVIPWFSGLMWWFLLGQAKKRLTVAAAQGF